MAKTANEEFLDALVRHQTYLLRFSSGVRNRMQSVLDATEQDIADKIAARLAGRSGLAIPVEWRRLQALVAQIEALRAGAWDEANKLLQNELVALALQEPVAVDNMVKVSLPVEVATVLPTNRFLKSIALARPFEGKILSEWAKGMAKDDVRRIGNAIQLGMTAGEDMRTISRRVVGTGALRGADGITELTRRQVDAVVRTAVMHVSNHSRDAYFAENADIIEAEYFVATLDSRTTPVCRANDGKVFPLGKGPRPPLHWRCRSLRVAHLSGTLLGDRPAKPFVQRELVEEYARRNRLGNIRSRDDLPRGTKGDFDSWSRARIREMIGPVPASTTYSQWLARQSRTFQDDTLGVTRAKLFRDGKLPLDRFVNRNGDQLTLAQLAQREAEAFKAAGLNPTNF